MPESPWDSWKKILKSTLARHKLEIASPGIFPIYQSKENKRIENELQKQLIDFEEKLSTKIKIEEIEYQEYIIVKADWERHIAWKNHGIIFRSKAKWVEEGEKNTQVLPQPRKKKF